MDEVWQSVRAGEPLWEIGVIDAHTHLGPWFAFRIPGNPETAGVIEMMDRLGIATIVCAPHLGIGPNDSAGNDLLRQAASEQMGRILGYCAINPNRSATHKLEELKRCADDPFFVGIKIHPGLHKHPVDGPGYEVVWEYANEKRLPLLTHTWGADPYCTPSMLGEPARRHPHVAILAGHSGATPEGVEEAINVAQQYANIYLELTASILPYGIIERMVGRLGAERVIFGTDLPFLDPRPKIAQVAAARIPADDKRKIFADNAKRLFGIGGEK